MSRYKTNWRKPQTANRKPQTANRKPQTFVTGIKKAPQCGAFSKLISTGD